jgi:ribosomal protein S4E
MMKNSTKLSALALLAGAMMSMSAHAETQENVYDFANNNLGLEVATPADWEDATKGVISGLEIRQGDVVLTSVDGAKVNRMWRTNAGVQYLQVGGKITITADEGRAITMVNFDVQNYKFFLEAQEGNGSLDANNYVWNGNSTSITFDNENAANEYNTQTLLLTMTVYTDEANEDTYSPSESSYADCANIAEFLALEVGTAAKLTLNNAQVNGTYWGGTFLEDATGAVQVNATINVNRNDVLNGVIYLVRAQDDFDTDHIIPTADPDTKTSLDEVTITSDNQLNPTVMNINDLPDNANMSKLVKVQGVTITKPSRFYFITTDDGENIQLVDQMNVGGYDLDALVDKTVIVTGVFTWNMMRWAIFPTSVVEDTNTAVTTIMANEANDADVYTITGINLGKADINTLPAGLYIKDGKKYLVK